MSNQQKSSLNLSVGLPTVDTGRSSGPIRSFRGSMVRAALVAVLGATMALAMACTNVFGKYENPWDPKNEGTGTTVARVYNIGDAGPGGGKVFYVSGSGFSANGKTCHYLEVGNSDGVLYYWIPLSASQPSLSLVSDGIGAGAQNTANIWSLLTATNATGPSAFQCIKAYNNSSTYKDWFLPSKAELNELGNKLQSGAVSIPSMSPDYYFSSNFQVHPGFEVLSNHIGNGLNGSAALLPNNLARAIPVRAF